MFYFSNTLIVRGEEAHLFLESCKGSDSSGNRSDLISQHCDFSFKGILPIPNLNRLEKNVDAQEWKVRHWGTCSDAKFVCIREEGNEYFILFETEFSPPLNWLRKAIEVYPQLDFELSYLEEMNGSAGEIRFKEGILEDNLYDRCTNGYQYEMFVSGL